MATFTSSEQSGDLPPPLQTFKTIWSQEHADAPYHEFQMVPSYRWKSGKAPLPVAARPGSKNVPCKVVTLHAPMTYMVLRWRARRTGPKPLVPKPKDLSNATLLEFEISMPLEVPQPDGLSFDWEITGAYTYVLKTPLDPDALRLPGGGSPVCTFNPDDHDWVDADFSEDLLPSPG
jgi:hypothetical protein